MIRRFRTWGLITCGSTRGSLRRIPARGGPDGDDDPGEGTGTIRSRIGLKSFAPPGATLGGHLLLRQREDAHGRKNRLVAGKWPKSAPAVAGYFFQPDGALFGSITFGQWTPSTWRGFCRKAFPHNPRRLAAIKGQRYLCSHRQGLQLFRRVQGDWRTADQELKIYERPTLHHEMGIVGLHQPRPGGSPTSLFVTKGALHGRRDY